MAFEPKFEKVVTGTRKTLGSVQSQVECKFPAADEVKKIVCSNAKANITNVDVNGKEYPVYAADMKNVVDKIVTVKNSTD